MPAQIAKPARCQSLGRTEASTHSPNTAVTDVKREMASANGMGSAENHIISGIIAAVNSNTAQSSRGARNRHLFSLVFHSCTMPYKKQMLPNITTAQANFM